MGDVYTYEPDMEGTGLICARLWNDTYKLNSMTDAAMIRL